MAIITAEESEMEIVTEKYGAEVRNGNRNLFCHVAAATLGKPESANLVMAQTTGLAGLHFSHGNNWIFLTNLEKSIVT